MLTNLTMIDKRGFLHNAKPMFLYTYSTVHLLKKDKVRFYYALKGRDGKSGIMKEYRITHPGRTVLMVDAKYDDDLIQFFKVWNLPYTRRKILVDEEITRGGPP
mgnify:FL=1|jgi:hypothetical protein